MFVIKELLDFATIIKKAPKQGTTDKYPGHGLLSSNKKYDNEISNKPKKKKQFENLE
ncbi:hypothetical protein GCM10007876_07560 [Litoribrevibacter albus]|uniref:Uncharacterized protein n=1 Tax=Litoribrevibacter albus TaxID=1473156 RepID=A0AA37S8C2_9GAMM|nr:hypothetical protein GCM10007876_07560 [Litoribrevibacter albus]